MNRRTMFKAALGSLVAMLFSWCAKSQTVTPIKPAFVKKPIIFGNRILHRIKSLAANIEAECRSEGVPCRWTVKHVKEQAYIWYQYVESPKHYAVVVVSFADAAKMEDVELRTTLMDGINDSSWKALSILGPSASEEDVFKQALIRVCPEYVRFRASKKAYRLLGKEEFFAGNLDTLGGFSKTS